MDKLHLGMEHLLDAVQTEILHQVLQVDLDNVVNVVEAEVVVM
jgi:hypothetical protein